jgi:septal ring-binding cell division protein DamX
MIKQKDIAMLKIIRIVSVSFCAATLSSCMIGGQDNQSSYEPYGYQQSQLYPDGYDTVTYTPEKPVPDSAVKVPESYHVGAYHSPLAPKDIDKNWVSRQNPQEYTIQLAQDEKAARVAGVLQTAPKNERMAEIKYQQFGKTYYKGLYGSYSSQEAAQNALNALPENVKQSAGVTTWGTVQSNLSE